MKTLIKFLSDEPILNVLSPVHLKPEETVFIGRASAEEEAEARRLQGLLRSLGAPGKVRYIPVGIYNPEEIMQTLEKLHAAENDCMVDVSGSNNAVIFAVGAFCRANGTPTITFDPDEGCFRNISRADALESVRPQECFKVEAVLRIAGGSMSQHGHVSTKALDGPLGDCAEGVFDVFRRNRRQWSAHVSWMQRVAGPKVDEHGKELPDDLTVDSATIGRTKDGKKLRANTGILRELAACGAILDLRIERGRVFFRFPSALIRSCLKDPGVWLELYTCQTALKSGAFDDVQISVVIDWNGIPEENDLLNEIDVSLTRGLRPVFISCKIGTLTQAYVNEIFVLCDRFGGYMARPVIVTMTTPKRDSPALMKRAESLGVTIIDRTDIEAGRLLDMLRALAQD